MNIKDIIKDNTVAFDSYRQGFFYYNVGVTEDYGDGKHLTITFYQFPVPLHDIGTATLLARDKAITYMRWIRKAIEDKTFIKIV